MRPRPARGRVGRGGGEGRGGGGSHRRATAGADGAGAVNVVVTNPDTQTGSLTNGYTYVAAPTVGSVSPGSGAAAGGTAVTITGTNFVTGATVTFGGTGATHWGVARATQTTATSPAHY